MSDRFEAAVALHRAGRLAPAERLFREILAAEPAHPVALHLTGMIAAQTGRFEEAARLIEASIRLSPDVPEAHSNLGAALRGLGRNEEALVRLDQAIALKPRLIDAYFHAGVALQELGRAGEARAMTEKALAIDPQSPTAWYMLSQLKEYAAGDPEIETMSALLEAPSLRRRTSEEQAQLEFALAKALIDAGEADPAFARLASANRLKRSSFAYDVEADTIWLAATTSLLSPERLAGAPSGGHPTDRPVFVLGMPRSGTTLVEQILASHPSVYGAGELRFLEEAICEALGQPNAALACLELAATPAPERFARIGGAYARRIASLAPASRRIVDKMPGNFRFAALIPLVLPNARIIHCRRERLDTCFSLFSRNFAVGAKYSYDLVELGRYYRAYDGLMADLRRLLPTSRLLEVAYEDLVGDLEGSARRLIDFCGLEWDDACLRFFETKRLVRTASVNQVRRPIYDTSIGRSRRYEAFLGPLLEALG